MNDSPHTARAFDLLLFDLDGTLVQSAPEICAAVNDVLGELGLPAVEQQRVANWIGAGGRELLVQALAFTTGSTPERVRAGPQLVDAQASFERHYRRRSGSDSPLYPQVREVLTQLREHGIKLAIVTNKDGVFTRLVLQAHQLEALFDRVVSGDSFPRKKPDPAGIESCLEQFGVPRQRALFVGDSAIDVATARAAGVAVWALPYGYNMGKPIQDSSPDRVIQDFSALRSVFGETPPAG